MLYKNIFIVVASVLFFFNNSYLSFAQALSKYAADKFISYLISDSDSLEFFVLPEELNQSNRLDLNYTEVKRKYLIANNLDLFRREGILSNRLKLNYKIVELEDNYSKIILSILPENIIREYYFIDSFLISQPYYFARNWNVRKSKFFVFHISDTSLFNEYSQNNLNKFVDAISKLLKYDDNQINILSKNKIHYYLCRDENEIQELTSYTARGLYFIPYDYIITTYNCHYHELLHLLINFKLKELPLYTIPFLQEGFAVALGGRGGKEPGVILEMGEFLEKNNFISYNMLTTKQDFLQYDASISYPAAGLYNKFLIYKMGIDKYLSFYRKYSGDELTINKIKIDLTDFPTKGEWIEYLNSFSDSNEIFLSIDSKKEFKEIAKNEGRFIISENSDYYSLRIKDTLLISPAENLENYNSKLFNEIFPPREYRSEKYAVIADSNEISVYNFYSNNLIGKYVRSFSASNKKVDMQNNLYNFFIRKRIFEEHLNNMIFK